MLSIERDKVWRQVTMVARRPDGRKVWATVLFLKCNHAQERHVSVFLLFCHICKTAVCLDPEISLPWQRDETISSFYCYCVVTQLFSSIVYFSEKSRRGNNSSVQSKANWEKNDKSLRVRDATMMNTKYACALGCWKDAHGRSRSGKLKFSLFTCWNETKGGFGSNFADFILLRSSRSCSMMVWIFRNSV